MRIKFPERRKIVGCRTATKLQKTLGIWGTPPAVSARIVAEGSFPENVWGFRHTEPSFQSP